ncbi:MAG: bifunctional DNA primase/polymerase, partial [Planctomycetaceae bacterium]
MALNGGKHYLAGRIIDRFPPHRIYLEPFGGAGSVLLNKPPSEVEAYNDLDLRITRLFRVLRNDGEAFRERLQLVPYSQVEFNDAATYPSNSSDAEKAVCDFIRWRQSFGGQGRSWSCTTTRARGGMAGDVNAWWTAIDGLPQIIERLRRVQILCQPAIQAIRRFDHPDALIYCDPPYVHSTRSKGATDVYGVEMTDDEGGGRGIDCKVHEERVRPVLSRMVNRSDMLEAALRYAELGYPVFPCAPGRKEPLTANGFLDATTNEERIEQWWSQRPNANIAIATAGLLVVDVDFGSDWLSDDPDRLAELACGALSLTANGGRHYVFRQPDSRQWRNTTGALAEHVDTRADGGYILVPPAILTGGKAYRWSPGLELDG